MKTILATILICLTLNVRAITPYYFQGYLPGGAPQTNLCIITPWPPNQPFYIYGTNVITGLIAQTNTPSATGFFTNMLYPGVYTVQFQNYQTVGFFVQIYDTTNQFSLGIYATNTPIVSQTYGAMFNVVTNWLGYWPATNTQAGIIAALQYAPATNTAAGVIAALQYTPATNTPAGIAAAQQYTSATNTQAGIWAALGYTPPTNGVPILIIGSTNLITFSQTNNAPLNTNAIVWVSVQISGMTNAWKLPLMQ